MAVGKVHSVARCRMRERGQMTVELCVVLPVVIIIAAIVFNALTFFSYCAEFDRSFRNAVRVWAVSPPSSMAFDTAMEQVLCQVEPDASDNPRATISYEVSADATATITGTLEYQPTLFGLRVRSEVFGVTLPSLAHTAQLVVASDAAD